MTSSRDNDALGWAGDDDPTLVSGSTNPPEPADGPAADLPEGWTVTGSPGGYVDAPAGKAALSSPALVGLGILAGVYLLYTIGWFIGVGRIENPLTDPLSQFMFSLGTWLAVAAPLVWFAASYWLTRGMPRLRWTWLILGVVLLAPLPFIAGTGGL
ncbi:MULTISPECIES: DNA polymerase III subunit gamma/tau [unclassified Cryobacterium]|uniref:DNA polymerase III subunit gamma/tau n=1 Tax=unclassified Cryobacterium TaxID=2649013 RepID=UPI00106B5752|nr:MULTISPECIES: DNA polymerase III subunit gamma/tau [unclassified Cryobacterium]TFC51045.1 DNA polymerase III subunit gamma/tau [Cryobacterium sp. TMB3-1-2]TFC74391.1 DNA polymerase III subunit gamma/tau [Cryobacterium sp. TMB3-15]TFC79904.1 DNA polymerase III subunit gamma/tau [Cryobacterium sp. TMB3-10]TFD41805.1 DNA polymerase III subunit gamma/tau [Cryobacterium sp. TMB3-12]